MISENKLTALCGTLCTLQGFFCIHVLYWDNPSLLLLSETAGNGLKSTETLTCFDVSKMT